MNSERDPRRQDEGADELPRFLESKPMQAKKQATAAQKKQWIILGALCLVLVYVSITTFSGGKKKVKPAARPAAASVQAAVQETPLTDDNDIFKAPGLETKDRASPFSRGASGPEAAVRPDALLVLQGVLSDSSGSAYAVINEKIVKKGERMADKLVTAIESDSVTLRSDSGEEETLRMKT